jgi:hypothetical protein
MDGVIDEYKPCVDENSADDIRNPVYAWQQSAYHHNAFFFLFVVRIVAYCWGFVEAAG